MWAIYWRYLLALIIVFSVVVVVVQQLPLLSLIENNRYHPSAFWLVVAAVSTLFTATTPNGFIKFFFGGRLNLSAQFWRHLNLSFITLFLLLALLALAVQALFVTNIWGYYKLYFQPVLLVFYPLLAGSFILHRVKHNKPSHRKASR
jgi:intracellular septation protein A